MTATTVKTMQRAVKTKLKKEKTANGKLIL